MKYWLMAFRPKTLTAAVVPVFVGSALAYSHSHQHIWWVSICALSSALFIQIGTNLINDAIDYKKGTDDENRIGPRRVTQSGIFSYAQVMRMGTLTFILAIVFGVPLVIQGGWMIILIGAISILCGYAYTMGPWPLSYKGFGDLFVLIFFGIVAVGGVFYLHTGQYHWTALLAGLQVGMMATALIVINNLRDWQNDARSGKKTLAVRLGIKFSRWELLVMMILPFVLNSIWVLDGGLWACLLPFLSYPLAIWVLRDVWAQDSGPQYNVYLARTAALHIAYGFFLTIGLLLKA